MHGGDKMKKIFAFALVAGISIFAVAAVFADAGEEPPANVAPAMIQAPKEPAAPQPECRPAVQTLRRTVRETDLRTDCQESVTGTVSCIVPSSLMQPRAKLVLAEQGGNEIEFTIKTLAVIYDTAGNILSFDSLQQGSKVQVNYRALSGGCKEATAIKVLK
jgi:hypothetical protein